MFDMSNIQGAMSMFGGGKQPVAEDDFMSQAQRVTEALNSYQQQPSQAPPANAQAVESTAQAAPPPSAAAAAQTPATAPTPAPPPSSQPEDMGQSTMGQMQDKLADVEDTVYAIGGADGQQNNLMNSNLRKTVKKVASAIASFYTGGLSGAAMNVGSGLVSENNPKAGAIAGAASKAFGGGGGGGFGGF